MDLKDLGVSEVISAEEFPGHTMLRITGNKVSLNIPAGRTKVIKIGS